MLASCDEDHVWQGYISKLFKELSIPDTYYVPITRKLESVGCITKLRRGSNGVPSLYALHVHPDQAEWDDRDGRKSLTTLDDLAMLGQNVRDIQRALGGRDIAAILRNFEERLQSLETTVEALLDKAELFQ